MKTAFIGAGPGCKAIIEMITAQRFQSFALEIVAVMDIDPNSVGFKYAESIGISVFLNLEDVIRIDGLEVVFELVGSDEVLNGIYELLPRGVRVVDHVMARIFWELEEAGRRFHQIINTAHNLITIKDIHGKYLMVNKGVSDFFGVSQKDFVNRTSHDVLPPHIADLVCDAEKETITSNSHNSYEDVFELNGQEVTWETERFPITDYHGNIIEICGISRDITNEKRLRRELVQSVKMATLGQLAAGVAHEINNPLTGILSFAEDILEELEPSNPMKDDITVIIRESMRCRRIVRDLLDFSRLSKPQPEVISMNDIIGRVIAMVSKQVSFQDVSIDFAPDDGLPDVRMDPTQAQQVILNLVINAQEAMGGKGTIEISTSTDNVARRVVIIVKDSGCGIPKEDLKQIFEPFYSTKGPQGNGLGLPAVLRIVRAHDGTITVDSTMGQGTDFRIEIPFGES